MKSGQERKVIQGAFDYAECFESFLNPRFNEQKHRTALELSALFAAFGKRAIHFNADEILSVLDVGCGQGTMARFLVEAVSRNHKGDLVYYGTDYSESFVEQTRETMRELAQKYPHLKKFEVFQGDAFAGKALLPEGRRAAVALVSHMFYHLYKPEDYPERLIYVAPPNAVELGFLQRLAASLEPDGAAVCVHGSKKSDMFDRLSGSYGEAMPNAAERIAQAAAALKLTLLSIPTVSRLNYPELPDATWERLKDLKNYRELAADSAALRTMELISFALYGAGGLRRVSDVGELPKLIDEVRDILKENGGFINIRAAIQVLLSPERTGRIDLEKNVREALDEVLAAEPQITAQTRAAMQGA